MLTILFTNVAQVSINQTLNGKAIQNNLFFKHTGAITVADLVALNLDVDAWFTTDVLPLLVSTLSVVSYYAVDRTTATGAFDLLTCAAGCAGGNTNDSEANQVAAVVSFLTGLRGRATRGRNYVGGIPSTVTSGGLMTSAFATALSAAFGNLLTTPFTPNWKLVVASAAGHPSTGTFTGTTYDVNAMPVKRSNGVRRSRKLPNP